MLASRGNSVVGTDHKRDVVRRLQAGELTFEEAGMAGLFDAAVGGGKIEFTMNYREAGVYIIAVPTPFNKQTKRIDARDVVKAARSVLSVCPKGAVIVVESTLAPGTVDKYLRPLAEAAGFTPGKDIHLAHAPERIIPGSLVYELENNSRVIGTDDREVGERLGALYATFCKAEIVLTDIRTAEMSKVVENTYRDINIAYANELAWICKADGLNVHEIIRIANKHPRVNILSPGPGVGGHCISVDPWFLVGGYPTLADLIRTARNVNDSMPEYVLERVSDILDSRGVTDLGRVGLYGLTYKEDVDDIRESPTLQLLELMRRHLAKGVRVYDPFVSEKVAENQYFDFDEFLSGLDMLVIMVAHSHIKQEAGRLGGLGGLAVLDTRNACGVPGAFLL
jgi:UDP-N-acetyl-D-mannosaminuronic acid dehydrogenase